MNLVKLNELLESDSLNPFIFFGSLRVSPWSYRSGILCACCLEYINYVLYITNYVNVPELYNNWFIFFNFRTVSIFQASTIQMIGMCVALNYANLYYGGPPWFQWLSNLTIIATVMTNIVVVTSSLLVLAILVLLFGLSIIIVVSCAGKRFIGCCKERRLSRSDQSDSNRNPLVDTVSICSELIRDAHYPE